MLRSVAERGIGYRARLANARVTPTADPAALRAALGGPTPEHPADPFDVVHRLADVVEDGGLMGMGSGRFFGFVIGGAVPAALGADWLVTAWDQNTGDNHTVAAAGSRARRFVVDRRAQVAERAV